MADTNKPSTSTFNQEAQIKPASPFKSIFPLVAIVVCAISAHVVFYQDFGAPENFEEGPQRYQEYQEWVEAGEEWRRAEHWTER